MTEQPAFVLSLADIGPADLGRVGGKGLNLGALSRLEDVRVPPGFCVTTEAYLRMLSGVPAFGERLEALRHVRGSDASALRRLSAELRHELESAPIPEEVAAEVLGALERLAAAAPQLGYAIRSSATAEDLPNASFAGLQDTFLNVVGATAVLEHLRRCWASLFTERAVAYRWRNGIDHRSVHMAVVVQQMVVPEVAGVLFTADPITGNRKVSSVDASLGLGEALVSGRVNADVYKVRRGEVIERTIATKRVALEPVASGGMRFRAIDPSLRGQPALTDAQLLRLVQLGRRVEAHFGGPQDVEWCLAKGEFHIVQSRAITTLFPVPEGQDEENRVYVSVGHGQMMTDAMKPLGISLWKLTTRAPMRDAGGRLFVDVTRALASPETRAATLETFGRGDPLLRSALEELLQRGDFVPVLPTEASAAKARIDGFTSSSAPAPAVVPALMERTRASLDALKRDIQGKSGPALFAFILVDLQELQRLLSESLPAVMASMNASWWLSEHLETWLGEQRAVDALTRSVPNNITSQMGLELLDVTDVLRPHGELVAFLESLEVTTPDGEGWLAALLRFSGGAEARAAIEGWLEKYGMRGVGEIDLTRPRFSERPSMLVPLLLNNLRNAEPGASRRRFEQGMNEARAKEQELLGRLRALPDGARKVEETRRMIGQLRAFSGYREFPKYAQVSRYFVYKQALLREAEELVHAGVLREREDLFFLTFEELHEVSRSRRCDPTLIVQRRAAFEVFEKLEAPRVLTSDGEKLNGTYATRERPRDALLGLAVSAGTVEGTARVVLEPAHAIFEPGDILVTRFTDPSWTPAFVSIRGLVTEVGGLMTHGAVIAREYGLPAVVGVEHATSLLRDGQRIRLDGTGGYVELLE